MAIARAVMKRLNYSLLALRSLNFAVGSVPILPCHSGFPLSTIAEKNDSVVHHLQNPFAHFASTKFNISSVDIARMFKVAPQLQRLETLDGVKRFVGILEENGFKQEQIAKIMRSRPGNLNVSYKELLEPKLQLLKDYGICGEHLVKILTSWPLILTFNLEQRLIPTLTFLQNVYQSQDLFLKAVLRNGSILTFSVENTLKPSIAFWEGHGFHGMELSKFLAVRPSILLCSSFTTAQVDLIQKIGIDKGDKMYRHVLIVVATSRMVTLQAKIHNFQLCGLSYEETMEFFRRSPHNIGFTETVRVLALRGARIFMPARNVESGNRVKETLLKENPTAKVDVMELDVSSLKSVYKFAASFKSLNQPLNILINNAGIMACPFQLSEDGIELQFATNHLGHFLLTNLLLDKLKATAKETGIQGRIINVSSTAHKRAPQEGIRFDKINDKLSYSPFQAYGQSKLANILHANELARHLEDEGANVTVNSLHPGVIATNIVRYMKILAFPAAMLKFLVKSIPQGAATTCYLALHPNVKGTSGKYFSDCEEAKPTPNATNPALARELWDFSEKLVSEVTMTD